MAFLSLSLPTQAQFLPQSSDEKPAISTEDLTPELVDGVLAGLTDSEIRELLRAELVRQAEDKMVEETGPGAFELIDTRLTDMAAEIDERTTRWAKALANIDNRFKIVNKRLQEGDHGLTGTILAALTVIVAGFGAAFMTLRITRGWRTWLMTPIRNGYWDKVVRTVALGLVDMLAIVAFIVATRGAQFRYWPGHWAGSNRCTGSTNPASRRVGSPSLSPDGPLRRMRHKSELHRWMMRPRSACSG